MLSSKLVVNTLIVLLALPRAYGETVAITPVTPQTNPTTASTSTTPTTQSTVTGTATSGAIGGVSGTMPSMSNQNVNKSAGDGKNSQAAGMLSNLMSSGMMVAAAMPMLSNTATQPTGYMMLAMAALAAAQGALLGGDAAKSGASEQASMYDPMGSNGINTQSVDTPSSSNTYNPGTSDASIKTLASQSAAGAQAIKALEAGGYSISKDGLTTPSGDKIPTSAFSSAAGMSAAGMTAAGIKATQDIIAKAQEGYANKVIAMGVDGGASGGGSGSRNPSSDDDDSWEKSMAAWKMKNPFAKTADDKSKLVAGKSVMLAGEPIGVASEDIFKKVSKHYQNKVQLKEFLE